MFYPLSGVTALSYLIIGLQTSVFDVTIIYLFFSVFLLITVITSLPQISENSISGFFIPWIILC